MQTDSETYERCPQCGHLVLLPCLACSLQRNTGTTPAKNDEPIVFGLDLRRREYQRYLQVRRDRQAE